MDKLIYLYPVKSSFVSKDIEVLSKTCRVLSPDHGWRDKKIIGLSIIHQLCFLLINIWNTKAIVIMFAGYWSVLPALLGKIIGVPTYIILGGTDCVSFPNLNYGSLRKPYLKRAIYWSVSLAKKLLPVDDSLMFSDYTYDKYQKHKSQGLRHFFPKLKTAHQVVYNGFDASFFDYIPNEKLANSFICLSGAKSEVRIKLKGLDRVVVLAKKHASCTFVMVGVDKQILENVVGEIPTNVLVLPMLSKEEFKKYLQQSEFILQLSISEGFPNALCEGMLCGCIPIGSSVGAIPKIIADSGFVFNSSEYEYQNVEFEKILSISQDERAALAAKARQRITDNYSLELRAEALNGIVAK